MSPMPALSPSPLKVGRQSLDDMEMDAESRKMKKKRKKHRRPMSMMCSCLSPQGEDRPRTSVDGQVDGHDTRTSVNHNSSVDGRTSSVEDTNTRSLVDSGASAEPSGPDGRTLKECRPSENCRIPDDCRTSVEWPTSSDTCDKFVENQTSVHDQGRVLERPSCPDHLAWSSTEGHVALDYRCSVDGQTPGASCRDCVVYRDKCVDNVRFVDRQISSDSQSSTMHDVSACGPKLTDGRSYLVSHILVPRHVCLPCHVTFGVMA